MEPAQADASEPHPVDWDAELHAVRDALFRGDLARGEVLGRALYDRARGAGATVTAGHAALMLGKLKGNTGDPAGAIEWARRAVEAGTAVQNAELQGVGWAVVAGASAESDRPVAAFNAIGRAMALADEEMPTNARRALFTAINITYRVLGLWQKALPVARRALEGELRDPTSPVAERARVRRNLLITCVTAYDQLAPVDRAAADQVLQEMREHAEPLLAEVAQSGSPWLEGAVGHTLGRCYTRDARYAEAIRLLTLAVDAPTQESAAERRERWVDLAVAQARSGDAAAARKSAEQALLWHVQVDAPPSSRDLPGLVALEEVLGRPERALALHRRLHANITHNLLALLDAQVAELASRLGKQTRQLGDVDLRKRAEGVPAADVPPPGGPTARTDALTGLPNRLAVERAYASLQARDVSFAMLMLEIDHFDEMTARCGHSVGDTVLKQVGALIAEALRSPDSVGRYGGDEFVVLLSDVDAGGGQRIAERLRQRVASFDWGAVSAGLAVTVSGGLVGVRPGEGLVQALSRADVLLYRAKKDGRNRIVAAPNAS